MWFKASAIFVLCLFPAAVILSPVTQDTTDLASLYARTLTIEVVPFEGGDYSNLLAGKPHLPDKPAKGCPKVDNNNWKKVANQCKTWDRLDTELKTLVTPRIVASLKAAESALHLTGHIVAKVRSAYHLNKKTDDLYRWTYFFSAPVCGAGDCTGHAYADGESRQALIWNAAHHEIFRG